MVAELPRRLRVIWILALGVVAIAAGSAQANTVVVGSSLTAPDFALQPFGPPATVTNSALPAPETAASPVDGTVVSWSFIGSGGPLTPRVLRPEENGRYSAAGTGAAQNATAEGVVSGPFPFDVPIKRGDLIGVDGADGAFVSTAPVAGATNLYFEPALVDGAGGATPFGTNPGEDAVGAVVRYCLVPKLKGKSGKAARRALTAADCKLGNLVKGKKRRPTKRVLSQGVPAGTAIADTQPVDLRISRKKKP
jgi:hypothetical protein